MDPTNDHCVKSIDCQSGYYGDPINKVCTQHCPTVSATVQLFADKNPNVKMCVYVCPDGYFIQNDTNAWECVSNCTPKFADYIDKKCVTTCPDGTFAHSDN